MGEQEPLNIENNFWSWQTSGCGATYPWLCILASPLSNAKTRWCVSSQECNGHKHLSIEPNIVGAQRTGVPFLSIVVHSSHKYFLSISVQFSHSVMSDSLRPHEPQHARPPCPSPTPGVHPNFCPLGR